MSLHAIQCVRSPRGRTLAIRYLLIATTMDLFWEVGQLPLYTLWQTATSGGVGYALIHCTAGDLIILTVSLFVALLLVGDDAWPSRGYARVALVATVLGASYTVFSEWLNVEVLRSWAYAPAMPVFPLLGTGLTPFLQWLVIPPLAFFLIDIGLVRSDPPHVALVERRRERDGSRGCVRR